MYVCVCVCARACVCVHVCVTERALKKDRMCYIIKEKGWKVAHCVTGDLQQELPIGSAADLENLGQLVNVVTSRKQHLSRQELCHNAPY